MKKHFLGIVSFRVKKFHKHSKRTFFELMINFDWKLLKKVPCVRKSISFELKRVLFLGKVFFFRWKSSSFTYKGSPFELNNFFLGKDAFSDKNVPRLLFPLPWRQYLCLWKFYFQMKTFRVYLNRIPFEVIFFFLLFQMKHFKAYFGRLSPEMKKRLIGKVSFSDEKVPWLL